MTPTGSVEVFVDSEGAVERGETIRLLGAFLEIFLHDGRYVVQSYHMKTDKVLRYCFAPTVRGQPMLLASCEDVTGQGLDLERDNMGRLITIRQRLEKRALRLDYDTNGLLQTVILQAPNGRDYPLARYQYDTHGRLGIAFDALNYADRYEYDTQGRLIREMAKDGGVRSYRYDNHGRCIWSSCLDHYDEKQLRFLDAVRVTEVTDTYDSTWRYQYLSSGQITSEWNPLGVETTTESERSKGGSSPRPRPWAPKPDTSTTSEEMCRRLRILLVRSTQFPITRTIS